jgi:hypothetical protein
MAIERAVLPEQVRVNILSSEGARRTVRCSHKRIVPSPAWNLSIASEVAAGLPGKPSEMREKAGEAVAKLADVTQQAGSQAKQTASSLAADANQKAKGFCRQASSRQLNVRRRLQGPRCRIRCQSHPIFQICGVDPEPLVSRVVGSMARATRHWRCKC